MNALTPIDVLVSEVGPRDGLQSVNGIMHLESRLNWIEALAKAGLREIEVGSFVPPAHLPQMAQTDEVAQHAKTIDHLCVVGLVMNVKGALRAIASSVDKISIPVSVSESHSMSNANRPTNTMVQEVRNILDICRGACEAEVGLSTAFGCAIEGPVDEDRVIELAEELAIAGVSSIGLSDTSGMAAPSQVRRLFKRLGGAIGERMGAAHFHNTRGQGLANVVAALDAGVTTFDSSQGGLGGCPYAPGATGNIVTEDLVFLLEAEGLRTGIDLDQLIEARQWLRHGLPDEPLYGFIPDAGLPKGFLFPTEGRVH